MKPYIENRSIQHNQIQFEKKHRMNFLISASLERKVDEVSKRMNISKSMLIRSLLVSFVDGHCDDRH